MDKFIVLGDLHLGIKFHKRSLIQDQAYVLSQVQSYLEQTQADLIVAGDVFDTTNPPIEAQELWANFLTQLSDSGILVYVIPGNHDSAARLAIGRELYESSDIVITDKTEAFRLFRRDGYNLVLIPFIRPSMAEYKLDVKIPEGPAAYDEVYKEVVSRIKTRVPEEEWSKTILVAHQTFEGGHRGESEFKPFMEDAVSAKTVEDFAAVWAGHLHEYQKIKNITYTGSLLQYAFGDRWEKSIPLWEIDKQFDGIRLQEKRLPIEPLHPLKEFTGDLDHCLTQRADDFYVKVKLTNVVNMDEALQKLQENFPLLCCVQAQQEEEWEIDLDKPVGNFSTVQEALDAFCEQLEVPKFTGDKLAIIQEAIDAYSTSQGS